MAGRHFHNVSFRIGHDARSLSDQHLYMNILGKPATRSAAADTALLSAAGLIRFAADELRWAKPTMTDPRVRLNARKRVAIISFRTLRPLFAKHLVQRI